MAQNNFDDRWRSHNPTILKPCGDGCHHRLARHIPAADIQLFLDYSVCVVTKTGNTGNEGESIFSPLITGNLMRDLPHAECMDKVMCPDKSDLFMLLPNPPGNFWKKFPYSSHGTPSFLL